jgi:hypothetical protein
MELSGALEDIIYELEINSVNLWYYYIPLLPNSPFINAPS